METVNLQTTEVPVEGGSNLTDIQPPKAKPGRKPGTTKRKPATKKEKETAEPSVQVNSFHLVAIPNDMNVKIDTEKMAAALQSVSTSVVHINMPPRYFNSFSRTQSGVKILPIPSEKTSVVIRMRDSYTDALINAMDYLAESSDKCEFYGVYLKRSRFSGQICQATIFHGIKFVSMTHFGALKIDKNEVHYLDVNTICSGLYEATTSDLNDLPKYINERFSL